MGGPARVTDSGRWAQAVVVDYLNCARRRRNIAVTFRQSEVACSTPVPVYIRYTSGRACAHSLTSERWCLAAARRLSVAFSRGEPVTGR